LRLCVSGADAVRGLNFGNPERHDPAEVMPALLGEGKFYSGSWSRGEDEPLEAYFRRVLAPVREARTGLIFSPVLRNGEAERPGEVTDLWRRLHDE
jgi:hypothetical protein